ncbi:redoxin domain-containing protein [Formosa sediminum]|uniref:Redoxin domain-containing protein n=1 Tax=Formosa sediminum TaxID=2594004 RepID=A0A516GRL2_9FLAO|nr:TlpA disulfide reductase family protein [Formosa sediminum]QDO94155.1 redoxin domain-containing protein [Formosa sediminum]
MKLKSSQKQNIVFAIGLVLLIIPQTRQPIQVFIQKGLAVFSPSVTEKSEQQDVNSYQWHLKDLEGQSYNFKFAQNQVVLLNFWATWCPPCIAEMPSLVALHKDYKDKVQFLFVSNEDEDVIVAFLKKHNYTIPVHQPMSAVPERLHTSTIPRTLLISKSGKIVIDKTGASNWNSNTVRTTIEQLLAE